MRTLFPLRLRRAPGKPASRKQTFRPKSRAKVAPRAPPLQWRQDRKALHTHWSVPEPRMQAGPASGWSRRTDRRRFSTRLLPWPTTTSISLEGARPPVHSALSCGAWSMRPARGARCKPEAAQGQPRAPVTSSSHYAAACGSSVGGAPPRSCWERRSAWHTALRPLAHTVAASHTCSGHL